MKNLLNGILNAQLYHTENVQKGSVIERFNRTLVENLCKHSIQQNNTTYIQKRPECDTKTTLEKVIDDYNNAKHTTGLTQMQAQGPKNEEYTYLHSYHNNKPLPHKRNKFKINDLVRISKDKRIFDKEYKGKWNEELFKIMEILKTNPTTYKLKDPLNEDIKRSLYEQELQKAKNQQK